LENIWELQECNEAAAKEISDNLGVSELISRLLVQRGINRAEDARNFLQANLENLTDPWEMRGMAAAVERINQAITRQEKMIIYGDYDVDGVCSIVILQECLERLGGQVDYFVPNRFSDGYGLNAESLQTLAKQGCQLLITVDCGISSVEETILANGLGMDVIITDHHTPPSIQPPAWALINPKNDAIKAIANLAGAGVVFKLACALAKDRISPEGVYEWLDLVALATVADIVPLLDENRILVKYGLRRLKETKRPGLRALIRETGLEGKSIESWQVGFMLAPRLNSAGRMESARTSVELLRSRDEQYASQRAAQLGKMNNERRQVEEVIYQEAIVSVESDARLAAQPILVVGGEGWHQGVIGIVAARLAATYNRPAVVISWEGSLGKGSARSIDGFNLYEALDQARNFLLGFGGHKMAAGLSINRTQLLAFQEALEQYAEKRFIKPEYRRIKADMEIEAGDIHQYLLDEIATLRPFGEGNPMPRFVLRSNAINRPLRVGNNRAHLKFRTGPQNIDSIIFNRADINESTLPNCSQDLLFEIDQNDFGGKKNLQLKVKDVRSTFLGLMPSKDNNNSVRLAQAVGRAVEENVTGHPVLFVYPTYRSLLKHQAVMEYFLNGHNVQPLHGHLQPADRILAQNKLSRGNGQVFLITRSFLQYYQNNMGLPGNLRYMVRMWPGASPDGDLANHSHLELENLEQSAKLVLYHSREIPADGGHILVYANQPQTVRHFNDNYPEIKVEAGILDMSQRRAVRRKYTSGAQGIMLSDGTHTAGWPHISEIDGMILADSPLGLYEIAALTDYLRIGQELRVGVAFEKNSLAVNHRYLERLYPEMETVRTVMKIFNQIEDSRRELKMDDLVSIINRYGNKQYARLEILSVLRVLADLDLCRFEKSGNIRGIYSEDAEKLISSVCNTPYYMEGLAEKQILADWEMELNNALVW